MLVVESDIRCSVLSPSDSACCWILINFYVLFGWNLLTVLARDRQRSAIGLIFDAVGGMGHSGPIGGKSGAPGLSKQWQ